MPYTIIHPGGLLPHVGSSGKESAAGGERQLFLGTDDSMMKREYRLIPREDVAEICLLALKSAAALNRSFDIVAGPVGDGQPFDGNLDALLSTLDGNNADYSQPDLSMLD